MDLGGGSLFWCKLIYFKICLTTGFAHRMCLVWGPWDILAPDQELLCGPLLQDRARIVALQPEMDSCSELNSQGRP